VPVDYTSVVRLPERLITNARRQNVLELPAGFTNVVFRVLSFTEIGSLHLVSRAHATLLRPQIGAQPSSSLAIRLEGSFVSTNLPADVMVPPVLPGPTLVADERFRPGAVSFPNRTDWPKEQETTNSDTFHKLRARAAGAQIAPRVSPFGRNLIRGILVLSAIGFAVVVAYSYREAKKSNLQK
jgi:hypothetical protein